MNRDTDPALPRPPGHRARPTRTRRLRILVARLRALAWKLVRLSGEEFVKSFANKASGITAPALGAFGIAYLLGVDPGDAVRSMHGHVTACLLGAGPTRCRGGRPGPRWQKAGEGLLATEGLPREAVPPLAMPVESPGSEGRFVAVATGLDGRFEGCAGSPWGVCGGRRGAAPPAGSRLGRGR